MSCYRPTYMHFWQLKTFWHQRKLCLDDVEVHTFEEFGMSPAIRPSDVPEPLHLLVKEVVKFKAEFTEVVSGQSRQHDLSSFWMRKTRKPVLAVLLVSGPNNTYRLFRGVNMEVSMPTGSLCAERNVIGSALASDLSLGREDILAVAVLSVQLYSPATAPSSPVIRTPERPVRSCCLDAVCRCKSTSTLTAGHPRRLFADDLPITSTSTTSTSATEEIVTANTTLLTTTSTSTTSSAPGCTSTSNNPSTLLVDQSYNNQHQQHHRLQELEIPMADDTSSGKLSCNGDNGTSLQLRSPDHRQMRLIRKLAAPRSYSLSDVDLDTEVRFSSLFSESKSKSVLGRISESLPYTTNSTTSKNHVSSRSPQPSGGFQRLLSPTTTTENTQEKVTRIMVEESDLNPLRPCGACREWLRKVAEVNPRFRVVTFTDSGCKGVIIEPVEG